MKTYKVKIDYGSKHTKNEVTCDLCGKLVPANKNMWEVTGFRIEDGPGDERERFLTNDYCCSKVCANMFILKEL